jgi:SAM-dependent methyltransferase
VALVSKGALKESQVSEEAWAMLGCKDLEAYTLWDFPDQGSAEVSYGDRRFNGVTPAGCVTNLVRRYTRPGDWVIDPMAGSGTVSDVARALGRRAVSLDLAPRRRDIVRADARAWPVPSESAWLAVIDSPYSNNIAYSEDPRCIGRISCGDPRFLAEMELVIREGYRVLRPGGVLAWIISDEYRRGAYVPVGFHVFSILSKFFRPIDTIVLARHNDRSATPMWEHRARRSNFFLRGFKFLFLVRKAVSARGGIVHGTDGRIGA